MRFFFFLRVTNILSFQIQWLLLQLFSLLLPNVQRTNYHLLIVLLLVKKILIQNVFGNRESFQIHYEFCFNLDMLNYHRL